MCEKLSDLQREYLKAAVQAFFLSLMAEGLHNHPDVFVCLLDEAATLGVYPYENVSRNNKHR